MLLTPQHLFYGADSKTIDVKQVFLLLNKDKDSNADCTTTQTTTKKCKHPKCNAEFSCTSIALFEHKLGKTLYCKTHKGAFSEFVKVGTAQKLSKLHTEEIMFRFQF